MRFMQWLHIENVNNSNSSKFYSFRKNLYIDKIQNIPRISKYNKETQYNYNKIE